MRPAYSIFCYRLLTRGLQFQQAYYDSACNGSAQRREEYYNCKGRLQLPEEKGYSNRHGILDRKYRYNQHHNQKKNYRRHFMSFLCFYPGLKMIRLHGVSLRTSSTGLPPVILLRRLLSLAPITIRSFLLWAASIVIDRETDPCPVFFS